MQKIAVRKNGVWAVKTWYGNAYFRTLEEVCEFITYKE